MHNISLLKHDMCSLIINYNLSFLEKLQVEDWRFNDLGSLKSLDAILEVAEV